MYVGINLMPTGSMTSAARRQQDVTRGIERRGRERRDPSLDLKENIISGIYLLFFFEGGRGEIL
jgi:hypothetical protein